MSELNRDPQPSDPASMEAAAPPAAVADSQEAIAVEAPPDPHLVCTLADGTKVKRRVLRMRACSEKDAKGKLCAGHLKRWFRFGPELAQRFGQDAEIYRCEKCRTIYLPHPEDPRTGSLSF
ncbi:MAG: hypothetical protein MUF01_06585 [Bryobacterales bacterium]|jgi:hypothetical protein|nr:hypothetical protein [Bryobacterales bacterium]